MWLSPIFVFPWFIILLCFLIHLMHFLNTGIAVFFSPCVKEDMTTPPPSPLTTPKNPFLFIDRLLETGRWGPGLVRLLSHLQPAAVYKKNSDFFDLLVGKKKQTKKVTWLKEVTDRQHALYQSAQSIAPHLSGSWEPGMLSDALGSVCTAIMWSQVCRNEAVFSYFYCSRWL